MKDPEARILSIPDPGALAPLPYRVNHDSFKIFQAKYSW